MIFFIKQYILFMIYHIFYLYKFYETYFKTSFYKKSKKIIHLKYLYKNIIHTIIYLTFKITGVIIKKNNNKMEVCYETKYIN